MPMMGGSEPIRRHRRTVFCSRDSVPPAVPASASHFSIATLYPAMCWKEIYTEKNTSDLIILLKTLFYVESHAPSVRYRT